MKFRPSQQTLWLAWGTVAASVVAFFTPLVGWLLAGGWVVIVLLGVLDYLSLRREIAAFQVEVEAPDVVGRGRLFRVRILVDRTFSRPAFCRLHHDLPRECDPNFLEDELRWEGLETWVIENEYRIHQRGHFTLGAVWLSCLGRYRILEFKRCFERTDLVRVFPETYLESERLLKDAGARIELLDKVVRERQHGVGTEFESLTEYREGDDPRRIDWRSSSKHRRLIVRRHQIERHRDVVVVVDSGRLMAADHGGLSKLDAAIDAGLLIARVALASGDRCGFALFDVEVRGYVPPQAGLPALKGIQERVYDIQSRWKESDFSQMFATLQTRQPKRSLMIVISDILDLQTTERFRSSLQQLTKRHVVLFAALKTPLLQAVLNEEPDDLQDVWKSTLAYRLLDQRDEALESLRKAGVYVVDVKPENLGVRLVNQFLELRARNVL
ncbi:MAG: DUF58 domain-containing protein [Planctomycetaceae bacterium]|nr:DUF58 domain-containing protein [Planctomycetaceae bacterium]